MKNKKVKLILGLIVSAVFVILLYFTMENNNQAVNELEKNSANQNNEISQTNENLDKTQGMINSYASDIKILHKSLDCPIYIFNTTEEKELLKNTYDYIIESKVYDKELVFQLGPIRKESQNIYFIDIVTFEDLDVKNTFDNLNDFFPTSFIKSRLIKCNLENDTVKYEVIQ